jgi:Ca-activated chloride channel homolog
VRNVWPHLIPWLLVLALGLPLYLILRSNLDEASLGEEIVWKHPRAAWLILGGLLVGTVLFHLRRHHAAAMAFTRVGTLAGVSRGLAAYLASVPGVLRVLALFAIAGALGQPQTYKTVTKTVQSMDIMVVFDMSKSMEEGDMAPRRDRMDAAQYVVREFLSGVEGDRVGLSIFAQGAMLQCPLTHDMKVLDWIVADLKIGDVPESGTAIGDGLAMALGELDKSDAKSKVVLLFSDGDNNVVTAFTPEESADLARKKDIKVFTILVGAESDFYSIGGVNPDTLRGMARVTGGEFFKATDVEKFKQAFIDLREQFKEKKLLDERAITTREPDKQLFGPMILAAVLLLLGELVLASTRFRRFP